MNNLYPVSLCNTRCYKSEAVWPHRIGILGGLGPFAHVELELRLLEATARKLKRPLSDQDFPPWIVASIPQAPDRTAAVVNGADSPVSKMVDGLRMLAECQFALIPCNTAHAFLDKLREHSPIPILDMVEETIAAVVGRFGPNARVGLLASTGTLVSSVYQRCAQSVAPGVDFITPAELEHVVVQRSVMQEEIVMKTIYGSPDEDGVRRGGIKSGAYRDAAIRAAMRNKLLEITEMVSDQGADVMVLGCTELPLVLGRSPIGGLPLLDPLEIVADAAVEIAAGERPLPA